MWLEPSAVSAQHALILWTGKQWKIRDLASRNGTFVNSRRLPKGEDIPIRAGAKLRFANTQVTLVSDAPPLVRANCVEDGRSIDSDPDGVLKLMESPLAVVVPDGKHWVLDAAWLPVRNVEDQEIVTLADSSFRLELLPLDETTESTSQDRSIRLVDATLVFRVSRDGEHVTAELQTPGESVKLPTLTCLHVLLVLARFRLADQRGELSASTAGWRYNDELQQSVKMDRTRFDIEVHRARRAFRDCGVVPADGIVERRRDTHQSRIGMSRLKVIDEK